MTLARLCLQIFLAGCVWTRVASGQTGTGFGGFGSGTGSSGTTTGGTTSGGSAPARSGVSSANQAATEDPSGTSDGTGSSSSGTGANTGKGTGSGTGTTTPSTPPPGAGTTPPTDPFGFGPPPTTPGTTPPFGPTRPGATTTFGLEPRNAAPAPVVTGEATTGTTATRKTTEEAPSYTAPSFYGAPRQVLTPGQGRFARPRYRYTVSTAIGFDDNTQQTPERDNIEDQVVRQVIPAQPEVAVFQTVREQTGVTFFAGQFQPTFRTVQKKVVLRPAQPEQVIETPIPGFEFAERNASVVSRLDGQVDVQWANARELFTMDLRAGAEYYWNRDKDPLQFNGSLAATYLRRLTPRMQATANASMSYQSEPDYSQINVSDTAGGGGGFFVGNVKLDLSYRWAARFSTVTSVTGSSILYSGDRSVGSFYDVGLGNEFRYTQSRRTTWVLEGRYSHLQYLEALDGAISTFFFLLGSDWTVSRRLRTTLRIGQTVRKFPTGGNASSPYGEVGVFYQPTRRDQLSLTGRYGFEQTASADEQSVVGRVSVGYTRTFSPRFQGSLTANYVRSAVTNRGFENTTTLYDAALVLQYMFTRRFSMNARYSYTLSKTEIGQSDFDRTRFFLTGEYEF
jgi:hypothetical protein